MDKGLLTNFPGLTDSEIVGLREKYGENKLPERGMPSDLRIFVSQLSNPLVLVLIVAAGMVVWVGKSSDLIIILLSIIINTVLGFVQERKAGKALYALKKMLAREVEVMRGGVRKVVSVEELVPGDIVFLFQGGRVPADGELVYDNRLMVDEAMLTGESVPVIKKTGDEVSMGTIVTGGQGAFLVKSIGKQTKMGAIAVEVQELKEDTPLRRQLDKLSRQILIIVVGLALVVLLLGVIRGNSLVEMMTTSVALAVSAVPEGLLVSMTVVLAIGMQRIAAKKGLVRKLASAETLGGVSVICVDKTGTITEGKMQVTDCVGDKRAVAMQMMVANDLDDPMLVAGYEWAKGINKSVKGYKRFDNIPFSPVHRYTVSLNEGVDGSDLIFVQGAPEIVLERSVMSGADKEQVLAQIEKMAEEGKRMMGFAQKTVERNSKKINESDARDLEWVGVLAFEDPVRRGVKESFKQTKDAGIRTIVITGDYPKTAVAVMRQIGVAVKKDELIVGSELATMSDSELGKRLGSVKLFARTSPEQKMRIVELLKEKGEVVAMMGDGVNDAPAITKADIGMVVAEASDVAKESADLVLLNSNYSTIAEAVREGRSMFSNMRKIILYLLSGAFSEIFVVVSGLLAGLPLPITTVQILWINLVSDGFPSLALTLDRPEPNIMKEKPRGLSEPLINSWMLRLIVLVSGVSGISATISFGAVYLLTNDLVTAQSFTFLVLGINSLLYVFSIRSLRSKLNLSQLWANKWLVAAVGAGFMLQALPFLTDKGREAFGVADLSWPYWMAAIGLAVLMVGVVELYKRILYRGLASANF